jgi:hypothetical protein
VTYVKAVAKGKDDELERIKKDLRRLEEEEIVNAVVQLLGDSEEDRQRLKDIMLAFGEMKVAIKSTQGAIEGKSGESLVNRT